MEDPVVPLERNRYGHLLAGLLWERQTEKILLKHGWEKIPNWECLFVHRAKELFLSVYVDDVKLAGKKHNIDPMWKVLDKEVDLGEPTSFLDHVYLGCTQRQCEVSQNIVDSYRTMFESRSSAGVSREITIPSKFSYFFMVLWFGGSCKEVCGTILWVGEQDYTTTLQREMHPWVSACDGSRGSCWREALGRSPWSGMYLCGRSHNLEAPGRSQFVSEPLGLRTKSCTRSSRSLRGTWWRRFHQSARNLSRKQGVAVTWTALTGRKVQCGVSQWLCPH